MRQFITLSILLFVLMLQIIKSEAESKFKIIVANMTPSMEKHALGTALLAIESNLDPNKIATSIAEEFDQAYGYHWFCLVGPEGFVSHIDAVNNTLIWFTYNTTQIILFKPIQLTPLDIISEARRLDRLNINVVKNEMPELMKENAILVTTLAIKNLKDFPAIANNITATFDSTYGQFWHCILSTKGSHANIKYVAGFYLSLTIDDLQLILFRTNQPSLFQDQTSIIVRSRDSKIIVVDTLTGLDAAAKDSIVAIAKEGIKRSNNFGDLANYVRTTVIAAPKYGGGVWAVLVSTMDQSTEAWNIPIKKIIILHIGEIRFVIYQP